MIFGRPERDPYDRIHSQENGSRHYRRPTARRILAGIAKRPPLVTDELMPNAPNPIPNLHGGKLSEIYLVND
jgi:hypothetical protein